MLFCHNRVQSSTSQYTSSKSSKPRSSYVSSGTLHFVHLLPSFFSKAFEDKRDCTFDYTSYFVVLRVCNLYSTNLLHNIGCMYYGIEYDVIVAVPVVVAFVNLVFSLSFLFLALVLVNVFLTSNGGCLKCCCAVFVAVIEMFYGCHSIKSDLLCTVNNCRSISYGYGYALILSPWLGCVPINFSSSVSIVVVSANS